MNHKIVQAKLAFEMITMKERLNHWHINIDIITSFSYSDLLWYPIYETNILLITFSIILNTAIIIIMARLIRPSLLMAYLKSLQKSNSMFSYLLQ